MNLKESFRYQNFLEGLLTTAQAYIYMPDHLYDVTKTHHKNKANPDADDDVETIDNGTTFKVDDIIKFIVHIITEKEKLSEAICAAKDALNFDIDSAIASNKSKQKVVQSLRRALNHKEVITKERGTDYKFNVEGNQSPYYYEIEVKKTLAFSKENVKRACRALITSADDASRKVDEALVNTNVQLYDPPYEVNDTFEDVVTQFLESIPTPCSPDA